HVTATGSTMGRAILDAWDEQSVFFKRVAPVAEVARLEAMFEGTAVAAV
ncbi:MAG: hypothetical protein QOC87_1759, partial [Actinomycetota bacterium]|nr:hypothetical protein [Actinomycetota bacterium]